ncbi:tumor necrosis factor receptor superfamily member wengen [Anopheles maculipalpis]|uniref:tumor necrosis factor receptor superfamily member wengen n=1 Tax=Anopheles maculipalpis TaxID=1496333 RepID=UPI0021590A12|nr:tumor necrosis factor receptor superfamily member wengen [Anopheles maculipalpis]
MTHVPELRGTPQIGRRRSHQRTCRGIIPTTTLVLLAILLQLMELGDGPGGGRAGPMLVGAACESRKSWWDPTIGECAPCHICADHQVVLRPCQDYMNTVCGTMKDLTASDHRPYPHLPEGNGNGIGTVGRTRDHHWKEERRKEGDGVQGYRRVVPATTTEEILWDWQVASLLLAIIGCLLFLLAAACVALNQSRQWRRIEKHFDADMEALSAQLVNHLASMQHLESGPILLENFDHGRLRTTGHHPIEVRCVYLDQLLDEKCAQKAHSVQPTTGNLYIEESIDTPRIQSPIPSSRSPPPPPISSPPISLVRHY